MTASRVAGGGGGGGRGGRRRKSGQGAPPNDKIKLKQPSAELRWLITAYLRVPLSTVENVFDRVPPQKPTELLFSPIDDEDEGTKEKEGEGELGKKALGNGRYIDKATLSYYGALPCRRQRQHIWEAVRELSSKAFVFGNMTAGGECGLRTKIGFQVNCGEAGRMPGLARDVLRWLVALNLSFPIRNIKRDFSNGFMVAEIFSHYFPADVHMHSYDYGSRAASKRDNWQLLNKFLKKKGFVVQSQEIEDIIYCRSEEAAGHLLGRMYNFLTRQRCEPGGHDSEQPFKQQIDSYEQWNVEAPVEAKTSALSNYKQDHDRSSCSESGTSSCNRGDYEEDACHSRPRYAMSMDDMYHGAIKLDPRYESNSILKMDDGEFAFDFTASSETTARFCIPEEEESRKSRSPVQRSRNNGSNAIEKARRREVKKEVQISKAGARGEELRLAESARKARVEAGLAFRSPHRERIYKQYTLPDYRQQKQFGYVELGRLGPGDPSPELVEKREKLAERKEFGRRARSCNIMSHTNPTLVDYSKTVKMDAASARKKALAFASKIPKPKLKPREEAQENLLPLQNPHAMSDLQILEAKHQSDKLHVESIRRDLEQFLR